MSFLKTGVSALGKLLIIAALAASFVVGMVGVVYLSLRGDEVKVPEIVGRDFSEGEREVENLGLKLKRRAFRYSEEKPNTVLEQLPRPGETVKTGQTILVVLSQVNPEGAETPAPVKKPAAEEEETDATDLEPDKPKRTNTNANTKTKKPAQSSRDIISNKTNSSANTNSANSANSANSNRSNSRTNSNQAGDGAVNKPAPAGNRNAAPAAPAKPTPNKPPANGETRTRRVP